jgi:pimeloyl-ACP methyl ester carboxylesterase
MVFRRTLWNAVAATIVTSKSSLRPVIPQELSVRCADGTTLAAQSWYCRHATTSDDPNEGSEPPQSSGKATTTTRHVLCLHGWLDNCRSFYQLAPALAQTGDYHVIALDLPGHGRSSHKSIDGPPMVQTEMAFYVSEAIEELYSQGTWHSGNSSGSPLVTLIGHSLGAGIASLYASSFPEQIDQLVLLDGAGFWSRNAEDISMHVRTHVKRRALTLRKTTSSKQRRGYPTLEAAIQQRLQSVQAMPGHQSLSHEVARELVLRAMHLDGDGDEHNNPGQSGLESPSVLPPWVFRHDSRFSWPNIQYITQEQNEGIFRALGESQVDTCILLAEKGWPFRPEFITKAKELIKPRTLQTLPGSHYLHADPASAPAVIDAVLEFLSKDERG